MQERTYYVYMLSSRTRVLYVGVTGRLKHRIQDHKGGRGGAFTSRYHCHRLVWFERYSRILVAIAREKELKGWTREKKIGLIQEHNPTWADLSEGWYEPQT